MVRLCGGGLGSACGVGCGRHRGGRFGGVVGEGSGYLDVGSAGGLLRGDGDGRGETFADGCGEGMGGLRLLGRDLGLAAVERCFGEGDACGSGRGTAARGGFAVDDFTEAAVLEKDVLAGFDFVAGVSEGVGKAQGGGVATAVFDTRVPVEGDADAEVEGAARGHGEAKVRSHQGVVAGRLHANLHGSAVEREKQGARDGAGDVEAAGLADQDGAAPGEGNVGVAARVCSHSAASCERGTSRRSCKHLRSWTAQGGICESNGAERYGFGLPVREDVRDDQSKEPKMQKRSYHRQLMILFAAYSGGGATSQTRYMEAVAD